MRKQYVYWGIRVAVSIGLVWLIFSRIHLSEIVALIRNVDVFYFVSGIGIGFLAFAVNTKKWQSLLVPIVGAERFSSLLGLNLLAIFYSMLLPGGQLTGEAIKSYHFVRGKDDKEKIVFSVVMDRLISLVVFILFGFVSLVAAHPAIPEYFALIVLFSVLSLGCVFILLFFNRAFFAFLEILLRKLFGSGTSFAAPLIGKILSVTRTYEGEHRTLRVALFWAALFQIINTVAIYLLALSLNADISFLDLSWINTLVSIVVFIPITIMGLGLREGSFVYLLSLVGVSAPGALGLSILVFLTNFIFALLGGLLEWRRVFLKPRDTGVL